MPSLYRHSATRTLLSEKVLLLLRPVPAYGRPLPKGRIPSEAGGDFHQTSPSMRHTAHAPSMPHCHNILPVRQAKPNVPAVLQSGRVRPAPDLCSYLPRSPGKHAPTHRDSWSEPVERRPSPAMDPYVQPITLLHYSRAACPASQSRSGHPGRAYRVPDKHWERNDTKRPPRTRPRHREARHTGHPPFPKVRHAVPCARRTMSAPCSPRPGNA